MDPTRFDHLTRLLGRAGRRRDVVGALLAAALGGAAQAAAGKRGRTREPGNGTPKDRGAARDNAPDQDQERPQRLETAQGQGQELHAARHGHGGKRHKQNKHKKKHGGQGGGSDGGSSSESCCGTKSCAAPKAGAIRDGCDYAEEDFGGANLRGAQLEGIDGRETRFTGADLRGAHFKAACLQGASFRRARLDGALFGGACLFDADFTGAQVDQRSAAFAGGLFCGTTMPDGTTNDRDCGRVSACCQPTEPGPSCQDAGDCPGEGCRTVACTNGQCVYTIVADGPDPNGACGAGSSGHCCEGACCLPGATECNPSGLCCAPNCAGRECGPDGCGSGGSCGECPAGATCTAAGRCRGRTPCTPQTCPNGCCDANNVCRAGRTDAVCGRGGVPCVACQAGQLCCVTPSCGQFLGQCVCTFDSCPDGCCEDFTTCRPGTTNQFCGLGGLECLTCDPNAGQVCAEIGSGEERERNCICTPQTCPNGCCDGGPGNPGRCFANQAGACGIGGALCKTCVNFQICDAQGQCVCSPQSCPHCQTCNAGTGQCQPAPCPPPADQCHVTGTCDPATGQCSTPTVANGTPCNDGNPLCINGQCCTAGHEVVHGGCFLTATSLDCPGCPLSRLCQCIGSVDGSPFFLCAERSGLSCSSNADCPLGQACASQELCIEPC